MKVFRIKLNLSFKSRKVLMIFFEDLELSNIERKHSGRGEELEEMFFPNGSERRRHQKYKSHVETKKV